MAHEEPFFSNLGHLLVTVVAPRGVRRSSACAARVHRGGGGSRGPAGSICIDIGPHVGSTHIDYVVGQSAIRRVVATTHQVNLFVCQHSHFVFLSHINEGLVFLAPITIYLFN